MNHYIFVYGTLKTNEPNHFMLKSAQNGTCEFVSQATTVDRYPLVIASKFNVPYLLDIAQDKAMVSIIVF